MTFRRIGLVRAIALALMAMVLLPRLATAEDIADVVIVGGGPAGMLTALEARKNGAKKVVILERRGPERSRVHVLGLRPGALDLLASHGIEIDERRGVVARSVEIDGKVFPAARFKPNGRRASVKINRNVVGEGPSVLVHTRDLEAAIQEVALRDPGIDFRFESPVEDVEVPGKAETGQGRDPRGPPSDHVRVHYRTGSTRSTVRGRFLIVADGAHSPIRQRLGIPFPSVGPPKVRHLGGVFDKPGDGRIVLTSGGQKGLRSKAVLQLGGKDTGMILEVPDDIDLTDPDAVNGFYLEEAAKLGLEGKLLLEPRVTDVELRRALYDPADFGDLVHLIGEAERSSHAFGTAGVSFSFKDAARFGKMFGTLAKGNGTREELRRESARFRRKTVAATKALHRLALPHFLKNGGNGPNEGLGRVLSKNSKTKQRRADKKRQKKARQAQHHKARGRVHRHR